ncbi:MAG: hypothetical protein ABS99_01605 [Acetobacteraceae bacterium SCN 69-10]|mgnify:FL=1|nr:MAG: hypothetical protein ABS99_01605 [Acetobacteraceae bacterium SCN 69-10]OJY64811.1 MAG: hypothetical protein BGP12_03480 [Rhodospirillales bacterium 70-18]
MICQDRAAHMSQDRAAHMSQDRAAHMSQDRAAHEATLATSVVAFPEVHRRPLPASARRLTLRDRVEAMRWADTVHPYGISRAAIHSGGDPNIGDFILIYLTGALWASWVVGCKPAGYCVWRAGSGADLGCFATLPLALAAVEALV